MDKSYVGVLSLQVLDVAIEELCKPTGNEPFDEVLTKVKEILEILRQGQTNVVRELLEMYDAAAELDVDIDRMAIYELAKRIAAVSTPEPEPESPE